MSKVTIDGVDCYGEMYEEQNISVVCEDEANDGIHCQGYKTWKEAVQVLKRLYPDAVQLEAI